ncbi:unnamed protein product [Mucor hiemalis]
MRLGSLSAELDSITREFDYGIVPGSATVFVRDELNGIGRLDLTLLEGVMIVLEVTDQGYKVTSCSPLCNVDPALSTAQTVQAHLEAPFESMENLLMTISPMFRDRFQQALFDKLQSVQTQQELMLLLLLPLLLREVHTTYHILLLHCYINNRFLLKIMLPTAVITTLITISKTFVIPVMKYHLTS